MGEENNSKAQQISTLSSTLSVEPLRNYYSLEF